MGALGSKPIVIDVKRDKTYYHNTYQIEVKHNPLTGRGYEDFKGFKLYRHELPSGIGYYFENIHHDGKEQNIPNKETFLYNSRGVTVFYWASDLENVLPLIIKYDSDESTFFYKKENIDTNKWSGINYGLIPYLPSDLGTTVKRSFGEVVIPNLSAAKTTTYCAHPSLECFKNPGSCGGSSRHYSGFLTLSVSRSSEPCQGYTKITQQGQYGRPFRILSTYCTFKGGQIQLDKPKLENVTSVSVYYWEGDTAFKNPLILELQCVKGQKYQEFYTRSADGKKWMHASNIDSSKLADDLDVLNCEYNNAVPVDICKRDDGTKSKYFEKTGSESWKDITEGDFDKKLQEMGEAVKSNSNTPRDAYLNIAHPNRLLCKSFDYSFSGNAVKLVVPKKGISISTLVNGAEEDAYTLPSGETFGHARVYLNKDGRVELVLVVTRTSDTPKETYLELKDCNWRQCSNIDAKIKSLRDLANYISDFDIDISATSSEKCTIFEVDLLGVTTRHFYPKPGHVSTKVKDGNKELWTPINASDVCLSCLIYKRGDKELLEITVLEDYSRRWKFFEKTADGWVSIDKEEYKNKLNEMRGLPKAS
ncbi:hypothetical protein BEWA_027220 [Theileria equi strain WA]|uniref:Uncharacterized protein n=1 Tax=Theileria equi strain WA TaxID=1537102 RepID=L0AXA2_THEEQ|nr:hypothetical protein BEWA_027220 [Theileria equi strain WA]AFZ79873.1 hypothetical protein BEWA_027220 [Theileria equi strain WA]|eukprot:XP_004829539.1 hypothetical protein BEWA_027220 [Theileria equi strain WA]